MPSIIEIILQAQDQTGPAFAAAHANLLRLSGSLAQDQARSFQTLTRESAQAVAAVEREFQRLTSKRDQLRQRLADIGLSAADRRRLTDSQGRVRSNTGDDQLFDSAFENSRRATALSRGEGDPNSIRAQVEQANAAAQELRQTLDQIRALQQSQRAGSRRNELAVEYLEATEAAERYSKVSARVQQLNRRVGGLNAAANDPTRSDEGRFRAGVLASAAAEQLKDAQAEAQGLESALKQAAAAQRGYEQSVRTSEIWHRGKYGDAGMMGMMATPVIQQRQAIVSVEAVQVAANAKVEAQRLATVGRVEAAEKAAASRVAAAQIAGDHRIEAERIRAENRLEIQQLRGASRGGALPRTFAGFSQSGLMQSFGALGLTFGAREIMQLGVDAVQTANSLERTEITVRGLAGSMQQYNEIVESARINQRLFGGSLQQNLEGLQGMGLLARTSAVSISMLNQVSQQLAYKSPEQGSMGAMVALTELLTGKGAESTRSLRLRYEIPADALQKIARAPDPTAKLDALNKVLTDQGITQGVVNERLDATAQKYRDLGIAADYAKTKVGGYLAVAGAPVAGWLANVLSGVNDTPASVGVYQTGPEMAAAAVGIRQRRGASGFGGAGGVVTGGQPPVIINVQGSLITEREVGEIAQRYSANHARRNGDDMGWAP